MENLGTPPPLPTRQILLPSGFSYTRKILFIIVQCVVLMLGTGIVYLMTAEREQKQDSVTESIRNTWGWDVSLGQIVAGDTIYQSVSPQSQDIAAHVTTQNVHRNNYETEIYTTGINRVSHFIKDKMYLSGDIAIFKTERNDYAFDQPPVVSIAGKNYQPEILDGVNWMVQIPTEELPDTFMVQEKYNLRGSKAINFTYLNCPEITIKIYGSASNPSFLGRRLPDTRNVTENSFEATWQISHFLDKRANYSSYAADYVGVEFLFGVDKYRKVERSLKYAFLIIVLTFLSVLCSEIITGFRIPLLNYFLIGAALILFYCLLLAFSEHITFAISYLVSAVMTVILISGYMWKILSSRKAGITIAVILTCIYSAIYILLGMSTYALLLGSLILFAALATMMYISIRIQKTKE